MPQGFEVAADTRRNDDETEHHMKLFLERKDDGDDDKVSHYGTTVKHYPKSHLETDNDYFVIVERKNIKSFTFNSSDILDGWTSISTKNIRLPC